MLDPGANDVEQTIEAAVIQGIARFNSLFAQAVAQRVEQLESELKVP